MDQFRRRFDEWTRQSDGHPNWVDEKSHLTMTSLSRKKVSMALNFIEKNIISARQDCEGISEFKNDYTINVATFWKSLWVFERAQEILGILYHIEIRKVFKLFLFL